MGMDGLTILPATLTISFILYHIIVAMADKRQQCFRGWGNQLFERKHFLANLVRVF